MAQTYFVIILQQWKSFSGEAITDNIIFPLIEKKTYRIVNKFIYICWYFKQILMTPRHYGARSVYRYAN